MASSNSSAESRQQQRIRRRRRRRPRPATAIALVALAASATTPASLVVVNGSRNDRRPPTKTTTKKHQHQHNDNGNNKKHGSKIRGGTWADAAVAAQGVIPRGGSNSNNDRGGVVVQPENLGGSAHVASSQYRNEPPPPSRGGDWAGGSEPYGGRRGGGGAPAVEYYKNGRALQLENAAAVGDSDSDPSLPPPPRGSSFNNNDDSLNADFEEWLQAQSLARERPEQSPRQPHVAEYRRYSYGEEPPLGFGARAAPARGQSTESNSQGTMSHEEWERPANKNQRARARLQAASSENNHSDVVTRKQVILRPRLDDGGGVHSINSDPKQSALPPMGSAIESITPVVYYYDPKTLQSSSSNNDGNGNNHEMDAPELTLPEIVYDSSGHALALEQVHAGGRNEVFLEVKPGAVWGSDLEGWNDRWATLQSRLQFDPTTTGNGSGSKSDNASRSQDRLIVLLTVATMAVMVGALSAKRLRSRKMLESCMHPELDDEDWEEDFDAAGSTFAAGGGVRYDKKFDVDGGRSVGSGGSSRTGISPAGSGSTGLNSGSTGFSGLLGGAGSGNSKDRGAGYYGTTTNDQSSFGGGGGLHWRGDMEKFDV